MFAYVVRRVFVGAIMVILMSLVTYLLFYASPIDYAKYACGKNCSPALIKQTKKYLGYDKPVLVQWTDFAKGVVVGRDYPDDPALRKAAPKLVTHCAAPCLGYSKVNGETVNSEIKDSFPISLSIALMAFVLWIITGVGLGVVAALRRGSLLDRGVVGVSLLLYAFPTFFTGLILLKFVAIQWGIFPVPSYVPLHENVGEWALNLVLPGITLAVVLMAGYLRMTRAFVLESMGEDYLRTARAKGLPRRKVIFKHSMRAALTPLVTMAGMDLAVLIGGAIITEQVFNYFGLGKLAVIANQTFDLPTIVGIVLLLATLVIVSNIIVDILYAVMDPRVRIG